MGGAPQYIHIFGGEFVGWQVCTINWARVQNKIKKLGAPHVHWWLDAQDIYKHFLFYCYPTHISILALPWPYLLERNDQKTNPWVKKYFFQKCSQNWMGIFLKFRKYFADSQNIFFIYLWCIELCARPVHVSGACLLRARPVHRVLRITNE